MSQPLISVIVPIYKAEAYLEECVQSIRNQTYQNLEIILVDDGSPDRCGEMCDAFAREDHRIRVFHKENGGQSSARNLGLDNMTGDYVTFADSDDWIEPNYYENMMRLLQQDNVDIAAGGLRCDFPDGKVIVVDPAYTPDAPTVIFTTSDALREVTYAEKITNSPCDKIFAAGIFSTLRFPERRAYEDFEIMVTCLEKSERIAYDPHPYYHYRMTGESVTRGSFSQKHFLEADISRDRVAYYKKSHPALTPYAEAKHIELCLNIFFRSAGCPEFSKERQALKKELYRNFALPSFSRMRRNTKIKYLMFLVCPALFSFLMNKKQKN